MTISLPTIDLDALRRPGPKRDVELLRVRSAAHQLGFFYLVGHGIGRTRANHLLSLSREFFALPRQAREAISSRNSPSFRGYTPVGSELTGGDSDAREQLDVGADHPYDENPGAAPYWRLEGPNQWPAALPALKSVVSEWLHDLVPPAHLLLQALLESIGVSPGIYDQAFVPRPHINVKLVRYPAQRKPAQGVGAHKDYGFLTLLLQDEQGGLEVEDRKGSWHRVEARPGTFVVNLGELLELATNGYFVATNHRVPSPLLKDRYSIPFFYNPRLDAEIDPLPLPPDIARQAPGVTPDPVNPLYRVYGDNALKGWVRAHPQTALRHHADLFQPLPHS